MVADVKEEDNIADQFKNGEKYSDARNQDQNIFSGVSLAVTFRRSVLIWFQMVWTWTHNDLMERNQP